MELLEVLRSRRAGTVGGRVALGTAVTGGCFLTVGAVCIVRKPEVALLVGAATVVVAAFAWIAGRIAGRLIDGGGLPAALGIGTAGGIASLVVAAAGGALASAAWDRANGSLGRDSHAWRDLGHVFFVIFGNGLLLAVVLGALAGGLIHWWLRRPVNLAVLE